MITVKPFQGLRPLPQHAAEVASPPYDVLDSEEAKLRAGNNPLSFLHVIKAEIDLPPGTDLYHDLVYRQGAINLQRLIKDGILIQDTEPVFYIYRMIMGDHEQTGLVAATSAEDYVQNRIKKHEHTKPAKESDRAHHIQCLNAHCGPVIIMYKARQEIDALILKTIESEAPLYDIEGDYDIRHIIYRVADKETIAKIEAAFRQLNALYIADGHHRSAAAARVMRYHRNRNPHHTGEEAYNYFLAVLFPDNQMKILDYNRVVKDLNGHSVQEFFSLVREKFSITPYNPPLTAPNKAFHPPEEHMFGMYLEGQWYQLTALPAVIKSDDPVAVLDVSILQTHLLSPVLGIQDPRNDERIHFVGGIRGLNELERLVDKGGFKVAFSMFPTGIEQIMSVADAKKVMPPKSTWFEPKLRSGLIIHMME